MKTPISSLRWLPRFCAMVWASLWLVGCGYSITTEVVAGSGKTISGSGNAVTENRTVAAFSRIEASGSTELEVAIGPKTTVAVTTDDNLQSVIVTQVEGDTLKIYPNNSYSSKLGLKVKITTPALEGVTLSGAGSAQIAGLDAKRFVLEISGAGSANLAGKAVTVEARLSGAGAVHALDLTAQDVRLNISGAGSAKVCATQSLDATITGAGSVRYTGNPAKVQKNVTGAGSIKPE